MIPYPDEYSPSVEGRKSPGHRVRALVEPVLALAVLVAVGGLADRFVGLGVASGLVLTAGVLSGLALLLMRSRVPPASPLVPASNAVAIGIAAGLAALAGSVLTAGMLQLLGAGVEEQAWVLDILDDPQAFRRVAPLIVLLGPIGEELFFRGYVLRSVSASWGERVGVVYSSLMFALIHMNWSGTPVYFVIALALVWGYRLSGSLLTPIVGHVTLNGIVLGVQVLAAP